MVKCADRVTPCHVGFHEFRDDDIEARIHPNGWLYLRVDGRDLPPESGEWSYP